MHTLFDPKSVVLIGVSRQTGVGAYNGLEMLLNYGYRGKIFLVHPQAEEILGHKVYRQALDLPEVPDLAVIAVGRDRVLPVVQDCLTHGIRGFIIISQGFADADDTGKQLQERLITLVQSYGARLLGPNTMGTFNAFAGFSSAFIDLARASDPPPVALVAQSGAPQVGSESFCGPLGKAIDLGNAAEVGFIEALEYLEQDPQTEIIALHMEGLTQGRKFLEIASRVSRRKPLIVFKTGRSPAGAQAALSHTGSLVGQDEVFTAAFARAGVIRVNSAAEMIDAIQTLRKLPPLHGPRLGVVTASGTLGIMAADALHQAGLLLGRLPRAIRENVEPKGPYWHRLHNPVDLWPIGMATGDFLQCVLESIGAFLEDPEIDGVLGLLPALDSELHQNIQLTPDFIDRLNLRQFNKPLALALYGNHKEPIFADLAPVPSVSCYASVEQACHALGLLYRYQQSLSRPVDNFFLSPPSPSPAPKLEKKPTVLLGQTALEFLARYQIPILPSRLAQTPAEATAFAKECGYPVVLKIISPFLVHKSDQGGVLLNLTTPQEVHEGFLHLQNIFNQVASPASLEGILVQKQIKGQEILLGLKQDATFGPVVVCGLGGIFTEVLQDVAQTLAPISLDQAFNLLSSLKGYPLLQGYRGAPPIALEELVKTLVNLSLLAINEPDLQELDINPMIATPAGCWAVDARIVERV